MSEPMMEDKYEAPPPNKFKSTFQPIVLNPKNPNHRPNIPVINPFGSVLHPDGSILTPKELSSGVKEARMKEYEEIRKKAATAAELMRKKMVTTGNGKDLSGKSRLSRSKSPARRRSRSRSRSRSGSRKRYRRSRSPRYRRKSRSRSRSRGRRRSRSRSVDRKSRKGEGWTWFRRDDRDVRKSRSRSPRRSPGRSRTKYPRDRSRSRSRDGNVVSAMFGKWGNSSKRDREGSEEAPGKTLDSMENFLDQAKEKKLTELKERNKSFLKPE